MVIELPKLDYAYSDLEPYLDAQTLEIHYLKHHQAYTDKMNAVLVKYPNLANQDPREIMKNVGDSGMDIKDQQTFINNGGGYINHSLFWAGMSPKKEINEKLVEKIKQEFSSLDSFKEKFTELAKNHFGSGWVWLARDENGKLQTYSTANQDSPYLKGHEPIFCLDVWEHAYYLKYQNRRPEYIENWWNILKFI